MHRDRGLFPLAHLPLLSSDGINPPEEVTILKNSFRLIVNGQARGKARVLIWSFGLYPCVFHGVRETNLMR